MVGTEEEIGQKAVDTYKATVELAKHYSEVAAKGITDVFGSIQSALRGVNTTLKDTPGSFDRIAQSLGKVLALTTQFDAFKGLSVAGGTVVNTMGDSFDQLITRFGGWEKLSAKLAGSGLSNIVSMGEKGAKIFLDSASNAQHLETAYINLQAATGNLSNVYNQNHELTARLSDQVARYGVQLANTSAITGQNIKTVSDFAAKLGTVGFALTDVIRTGTGAGDTTDLLTASMTLARGAGRDTADVLAAMTLAYEDLGVAQGPVTDGAQKGANVFALMSEASKTLGLRFVDTEGFLTTVAKEFKLVGDNTEGATRILEKFTGSLQSTGLTAKQSIEVITNMVTSMNKLEIGTKALISARSGGPGGLQGAFQVENLLREGKTDQVADMLLKSFKQQAGGRIYTQQEAGESPQAAAQFMRQRELLKSSAFGGLAKDDQSATRLLEAIGKGPAETASAINDGLKATAEVAAQGNTSQAQQVDLLQTLNNSFDRSIVVQEQTFLATARLAIAGGAGKNDDAAARAYRESLAQYRTEAKQNVRENAPERGAILPGTKTFEPRSLDRQVEEQTKLATDHIGGVVTGAVSRLNLKSLSAMAGEKIKEQVEKNKSAATQNENSATARQGQAQSLAAEKRGAATLLPTAVKAQQAATTTRTLAQAPRAVLGAVPQQNTTIPPREINLNVKLAEGLDVEVEDTGDRAGYGNAAANNSTLRGGVNIQVNK